LLLLKVNHQSRADIESSVVDAEESANVKSATQKAPEQVVKQIQKGSISNGADVYMAVREELRGGGIEALIAARLTSWVIDNFTDIVSHVRKGVPLALKWIGSMLAAASWWQIIAAGVGGLVVGGVAYGVARSLNASVGTASAWGVGAGMVAFIGILSAILD
jgi:hypothetical protein